MFNSIFDELNEVKYFNLKGGWGGEGGWLKKKRLSKKGRELSDETVC